TAEKKYTAERHGPDVAPEIRRVGLYFRLSVACQAARPAGHRPSAADRPWRPELSRSLQDGFGRCPGPGPRIEKKYSGRADRVQPCAAEERAESENRAGVYRFRPGAGRPRRHGQAGNDASQHRNSIIQEESVQP